MTKFLREYRWLCMVACLACLTAIAWWLISHGSQASDWVVKAGLFGVMLCIGAAVISWQWGGELQLQAKAPNEPWRWRADWARGEVVFSTFTDAAMAWVLVLLVAVVGYGIAFLCGAFERDESGGINTHWSFWAMTAVVAGLVVNAVINTRHWLRQGGQSTFRLGTNPGRIGGKLTGTVNFAQRQHASEGFTAVLACIRTVVKGDNTAEHLEHTLLPVEPLPNVPQNAGRNRLELPLTFQIPGGVPPTSGGVMPRDDETGDEELFVSWILSVKARNERDDFEITFAVPVFA